MQKYDRKFFDYVDSGALRSADAVVALLYPRLRPASVLDVGCGRGGWLQRWKNAGSAEVVGLDGAYIDVGHLHIDSHAFRAVDLSQPLDLGRRFDLVQSLEVAEHLPPAASPDFVASLVRHGDIVLFSAAPPGQGGTQHINERPLESWRDLFAVHGYAPFDFVRLRLHRDVSVEPWYRFNTMLYANAAGTDRLTDDIRASGVTTTPFADFATLPWRLRRAFFRRVPVPIVDSIAVVNARLRKLSDSFPLRANKLR
jgi:SAM-dependent methyltransferase